MGTLSADRWATPETKKVFDFLERPDVKEVVVESTKAWNQEELLGIDLAEGLEWLVKSHVQEHDITTLPTNNVDWGELAEHYAEEICGVDEEELIRRYRAEGGTI